MVVVAVVVVDVAVVEIDDPGVVGVARQGRRGLKPRAHVDTTNLPERALEDFAAQPCG